MNPVGRVPVIDDDGRVVWESHTILRYLAARYGAPALWSDDPGKRSEAERWMDWSQTALQPAFMDLFWGYYRTPEEKRDWTFISGALERCRAHYKLLDGQLRQNPYLAGKAFSLGDIPAATSLYRYHMLGIERPSLPHLETWYTRLSERPAYRRRVMIPFDELKGRQTF
jgi:glutathione S-transferase